MERPHILISEPNSAGDQYAFLPYVWAVLKSYWEHHGSQPDAFTWSDPIFRRDTVVADLERHAALPPDVVGLSCYTWNWDLQLAVARWCKSHNPRCLVVAGGPDPDYKDPQFFRKHRDIDMIVVKDGEIPFTQILETILAGGTDFSHIPGLYLPGVNGDPHRFTGAALTPATFEYSPYIEQRELYERIVEQTGPGKMNATWETNRGCPYGCSFCDWGSATMSKVRKFDMSRVEAEADWLGRMKVNFVFLADANFGILARDVDIAERLAEARVQHGHPKFLYYSSAKNNPERTVDIAQRLHAADLTTLHILSVQHTDLDVLSATDRSNIPADKYREVVASLLELDIPSEVQLIIGIPGDDPERWNACLGEIMEWGVHENYTVFPYSLLPNAPAADPAFAAKWQIESEDRFLTSPAVRRLKTSTEGYARSRVVVASRTFSRADWVQMNTHTAFVKACHNRCLTRLPAQYLRFVHDVPYREFYDAINEFARTDAGMAPLFAQVQRHFEDFLVCPDASDEMLLEEIAEYAFYVDPSRWVFVKTCLQIDEFYRTLSPFLAARFPQAEHLASAVRYQARLVIRPDYEAGRGVSLTLDRDWAELFEKAGRLTKYQKLGEPAALRPGVHVTLNERTSRGGASLDFGTGSPAERCARWIDQTVKFPNSSLWSNFSPVGVPVRS